MRKETDTLYHTERFGWIVAIPQSTIDKAINKNDVLHIVYTGEDEAFQNQVMTMDPESLKNKVLYSSPYKSKFKDEEYMLSRLKWNPNVEYDD